MSTEMNSSLNEKVNTNSVSTSSSSSLSSYLNSIVNHSTNCYAYLNDNQAILSLDNHFHNSNNNKNRTTNDNMKHYSMKFENFGNLFGASSISESELNPLHQCVQRNNALTDQYDSYFLKNQHCQFTSNPTQVTGNSNSYSWTENSSVNSEPTKLKDTIVKNSKKYITSKVLFQEMNLINETINGHEKTVNKELNQPPVTSETRVAEEALNKPIQLYPQRKHHKSNETTMIDDEEIQEQSKRYRTSYSQRQIELLEKTYQLDRYINRPQRAKLSIELNLPENTIKVWFQNRRMKEKRQALMLPTVAGNQLFII
ncbi:Homeobox even-skipped likerotein 1 [Schistosoma japonicum]|nr:Homeobox even-skipped likerotein 1 [Schistosoma japonicum]